MKEIILKNPWYIISTTFYKNQNFNENVFLNYLKNIFKNDISNEKEFLIWDEVKLRYNIINEIDYTTIEIWFIVKNENIEYKNTDFIKKAEHFWINIKNIWINLEIFSEKKYLICSNFLDLKFADELLYNIFYKKIDEVRYIYSSIEDNEFVVNFLKHIIKFDIFYSKILMFYKKFSLSYPDLQKSNMEIIKDYSKIIDWNKKNLWQEDLFFLTKKINILESVNFWLMYDIESLTNNLENLESRLKTIWAENSRYFLNHIEKAKFIIENFESILKKNNLIKENVLQNYIKIIQSSIESQKLENEKNKINHLKNIKEIISWLAFIEIFINWISESSKIFNFPEKISVILENTSFMRMILIIIFLFFYFIFIFYKNFKK